MGKNLEIDASRWPEIHAVACRLVEMLNPEAIYLYNQRAGEHGKSLGFKLCVVAAIDDKARAERAVYTEIDCEVPFDILLYTPPEWAALSASEGSFASKIFRTGTILYGE